MSRSSRRPHPFHNQPVFAVVATSRDAARRAVLRGKIDVDAEKPNVSVEQGRASGETRASGLRLYQWRCRPRPIAAAPLRSAGNIAHRRPGAFLSGRPGRACGSGRGRRGAGLFVDPASERSAAHRRAGAGAAGFVRDLPGAPHGRRLRRQGNASDAMGGDRGAGGARDRPGRASSGSTAMPTWR